MNDAFHGRNRMRGRTTRQGFTLVELMAATVSASILAVTMTALIWLHFATLRRAGAAVDLQRDATATMATLHRLVREARPGHATAPRPPDEGGTAEPRLSIPPRAIYRATAGGVVDAAGPALVYDPDTGTTGDEVFLARDSVTTFTCRHMTNFVAVTLELTRGDDTTTLETEVYFRNEAN